MGIIITDIEDDELNFFKKQYINVVDVQENIEKLEAEEPKDKRKKKEYQEWLDKLNFLYDMYNAKVGWKCYKKRENVVRKRVSKKRNPTK